jgi:hypothetical protein
MKYVKKPIVIEAFQFGVDEEPEWFKQNFYFIPFLGGNVPLNLFRPILEQFFKGHFIVKWDNGEIISYSEAMFKATYDVYEEN